MSPKTLSPKTLDPKTLDPKTLAALAAAAALCWASVPRAQAAGFPCAAAAGPDEAAVCADRALNDMDVEMATRFDVLKDVLPMGGRSKLREDQEAWLAERRACAGDGACLRAAYEGRLRVLRAVLAEFAKQGPQ